MSSLECISSTGTLLWAARRAFPGSICLIQPIERTGFFGYETWSTSGGLDRTTQSRRIPRFRAISHHQTDQLQEPDRIIGRQMCTVWTSLSLPKHAREPRRHQQRKYAAHGKPNEKNVICHASQKMIAIFDRSIQSVQLERIISSGSVACPARRTAKTGVSLLIQDTPPSSAFPWVCR